MRPRSKWRNGQILKRKNALILLSALVGIALIGIFVIIPKSQLEAIIASCKGSPSENRWVRLHRTMEILNITCDGQEAVIRFAVVATHYKELIDSKDLSVKLDNDGVIAEWSSNGTIMCGEAVVGSIACSTCASGTTHSVKVIGQSNSAEKPVEC